MRSWSDAERTVEFDDDALLVPEPDDRFYAGHAGATGDDWLAEERPPHWESR